MDTESELTDGRTELPTDFAEHAAIITGLDTPPETLEEWWATVVKQYSGDDLAVELTDLYSDAPTRHEVHVNDRVRYAYCVLDALQAAVMEEQTTVTVRSIDPVSSIPVTFTVSDDSVEASPENALICFGSSIDPEDIEAIGSLAAWSLQDDKDEIHGAVCQYTNAFESEATYEEWASKTGSITAPLPPANVVPLLQRLPQKSKPSQ
ncbi:organomercurial lyase [Halomarina halobia]|uniref:Organomercurial lyase n=1 Tax=Halomarina halobia TaxID=3033386 RepID=A0ABD6A9P9_9EURY|nr:organomercurial lyase [Halomarina sp. PSR21]